MSTLVRFDLKMEAEEKDVVSRAAALVGTTMAAFVRTAAKEKARELLEPVQSLDQRMQCKRKTGEKAQHRCTM